MFIDGHVYDSIISRPAGEVMGERLFAVITTGDKVWLAPAGGAVDGVTVNDVDTIGRAASIYTEGGVPVLVGSAGVTADLDVMVDAAHMAVTWTPGNVSVGKASATVASGGEVRVLLKGGAQQSYGDKVAVKTLTGAAIHAGVQAWQNPESVGILISRSLLVVATVATGAATLDIGTTATSATTASDNLIDGLDVNAATGQFDNTIDHGTNGKAGQTLAAGKWVTIKEASGDTTGLVATLYVHYILTA